MGETCNVASPVIRSTQTFATPATDRSVASTSVAMAGSVNPEIGSINMSCIVEIMTSFAEGLAYLFESEYSSSNS